MDEKLIARFLPLTKEELAMSCGIRQRIKDDGPRAIAAEFGVKLRKEFLD